ncbi:hypothetical protein [Staphylococcus simulans]|uniref:hypothetical protein n=1 Tax=Staphylococcus simulans TaxID=1286 RepID=UPI003F7EB94D
MKKLCFILATSLLLLSACNSDNDSDKSEKKSQSESTKKSKEHSKDKQKENDSQNKSKTSENNSSKSSPHNKQQQDNNNTQKQVSLNNITDRATLESVIYGNYSEMDKIQAYNSAVANGVIPQGNMMEGPASAAYQSSLRVESGTEKSIYEQQGNTQSNTSEQDVNAEINAAQTKDEYINALRKKYHGGLSTQELQTKTAIEQGYYDGSKEEQKAIYDEIQRRESDIKAGKYDQYKQ